MDDTGDVQATIDRLQREWLIASGEESLLSGDNSEPYKPSYCYGCARTGGVTVYRKPHPDKKRKREALGSTTGLSSQKHRQTQAKARPAAHLRCTSNLQVSARIRKKALTTLLGQKTGRPAEANGRGRAALARKTHEPEFVCDDCGKVLANRCNLQRHQKLHLQAVTVDDEGYSCAECGETFLAEKPYLRHLASHKLGGGGGTADRPYACDECAKTFRRVVYLIQHKKIHNTDRPFGCQYCPRMFKAERFLRIHEQTHLDLLPFPCNLCGIAFVRNSYLQLHMKQIHA